VNVDSIRSHFTWRTPGNVKLSSDLDSQVGCKISSDGKMVIACVGWAFLLLLTCLILHVDLDWQSLAFLLSGVAICVIMISICKNKEARQKTNC